MEAYRKRLLWIGENINIISGDNKIPAVLLGVDDECHLKVRYTDGSEDAVSSGEISIRLQN